MKKRLLLTAGALLIVGSAITILLWRYAARDASLSAFTEKDLAEASRRHAVDNGFATPVSSATPTVPIKSNQRVRLAIGSLGFSEDRQNHEIGDLLTAELSNAKGLELVDRQSFDK